MTDSSIELFRDLTENFGRKGEEEAEATGDARRAGWIVISTSLVFCERLFGLSSFVSSGSRLSMSIESEETSMTLTSSDHAPAVA